MKIPSVLNDQWNDENKPQDKFWGRVPMYLHIIPETIHTENEIFTCNPEYMYLVNQFMLGTIDERNLSQELYYEIKYVVDNMPNYGTVPNPELDPLYSCLQIECGVDVIIDKDCYFVADKDCYLIDSTETNLERNE